ncbi:MAG: GNAT family N-acetyltransferase [Oceanicoccus sp.]
MKVLKKRYPKEISLNGKTVELSVLTGKDNEEEVLAFSTCLPAHDLLFLSRDIQEPKVISAWMHSIEDGDITSVVARLDGEIVGTTAIVTDKHSWSSHVGELRILVGSKARDIGLGRTLVQESFLLGLDLGLDKLTARMTLDQEAAINVFEELGFKTEAMLRDHVKGRDGKKHDLLILSHDVDAVNSQMQAYGMDEAF